MLIPTFAPQAALWTPFDLVFPNVSAADYRERYYAYLYYSGLGGGELRRALNKASDRNDLNRYSAFAIFGHERVHEYLGGDYRSLTEQEVEAAGDDASD